MSDRPFPKPPLLDRVLQVPLTVAVVILYFLHVLIGVPVYFYRSLTGDEPH